MPLPSERVPSSSRVPQVALFYLGLLVFSQGRGRVHSLNIFIKVCYSLLCLPNTILACLLFPLLEDSSRAGNGSALSDSLPPLFSSLPTTNCSLSTLPPSRMESCRLPTPTP